MGMSRKTAGPLVGRRRPPANGASDAFRTMQAAELEWWKGYLAHPTAVQRTHALYGARYYDWFWDELSQPGRVVEIGSGPVPVAEVTGASRFIALDTLADAYQEARLARCAMTPRSSEVPDAWADTVFLLNVLDHTDEPEALVSEAYRMLRPGGTALVFVHLGSGGDAEHVPVTELQVRRWLAVARFGLARLAILPQTSFGPPAFVAVAVKGAKLNWPEDVHGWLTRAEGEMLYALAGECAGTIVELGAYKGKSTICLAQASDSVITIDNMEGEPGLIPGGYEAELADNLRRYGVENRVRVLKADTAAAADLVPGAVAMLFIDADHNRCVTDFEAWSGKRPQVLAFHDSADGDVPKAIAAALALGWRRRIIVGSLTVLEHHA